MLVDLQNATEFGPACPQQPVPLTHLYPRIVSHWCHLFAKVLNFQGFTLNVFKPTASDPTAKLPVFVWIYGGGFQLGNNRDVDVTPMVERCIETREPVIIVTPNYRVSAFGFLAGNEVGAGGISNLGLRDQIFALQWIQKNISVFGGDPARVVIGGQSAGAISASFLTLSNKQNSNELFRGLIAQSGPAFHVPSLADGQSDYDDLGAANNCSTAADTLECLRSVSFGSFMATVNSTKNFFSYSSLNLSWIPRIDFDVVERDPFVSISQGLYAKIPFMSGVNDDEGTLFSYSTLNIMTNKEFVDYAHSNYLSDISKAQMTQVAHLYPNDPTTGSPFDTGKDYQVTPEYKRMAAFQGYLIIVSPRRFWLEHASRTQKAWAWLNKKGKDTALGAYHGSDILIWFPPNITDETPLGVDAMGEWFAHIHETNLMYPSEICQSTQPKHPRYGLHCKYLNLLANMEHGFVNRVFFIVDVLRQQYQHHGGKLPSRADRIFELLALGRGRGGGAQFPELYVTSTTMHTSIEAEIFGRKLS
ncbi:sterol esterase [Mycena sanguinolenta]|nr:sterol esterase [Mycena sanguinolenta]